jgi:hypothetical protein
MSEKLQPPETGAGAGSSFESFALAVERRAIRIAELGESLHPKAVEHAARALAEVGTSHRAVPAQEWPCQFWGALYRRLATARGDAPSRAHDRLEHAEADRAELDQEEEAVDGTIAETSALEGPDALIHLDAALRSLSSPQRFAFLLRVWEGLDLRTVAQALEIDEAAAKTELFHALQRLHGRLAPGAVDRAWVLRCCELLEDWADALEPVSLAPLAAVRRGVARLPQAPRRVGSPLRKVGLAAVAAGIALVVWRGVLPLLQTAPVAPPPVEALEAEPPPPALVEPSPIAEPEYELLADPERQALVQDLDFYAWIAREHAADD